jgi:hypothetical protein|nr:MAG TPA: Protein of unknown function (DUF2570) [Caudoviricetes sp.]
MGRERAAKMGIALDRLFGCCLFIGCIGLSAQIYSQNKSLEILKEKYDKTVQLSEERMQRIDALRDTVADRNDRIEFLLKEQARERKRNEDKLDGISKIVLSSKCAHSDGVSRAVIDRLLKSE